MKAQKIGFVLGLNVAAACLFMQGCAHPESAKAQKMGRGGTATVEVVERPQPSQPVASKEGNPRRFFEKKNAQKVQPQVAASTPVVTPVDVTPRSEPKATVTALPPPAVDPVGMTPMVKPIAATPAPAAPKTATVAAVPATPAPAATSYVIQSGDTLSGISKRYNVKMSAILAANPGLKPEKIRIGKKINIPGVGSTGVATVAAVPATAETKAAPTLNAAAPAADAASLQAPMKTKPAFKPYEGATKEYVVKSGDSLGKIASENGISIRALKELNGLKKDIVRIGQKIKIPAEKVVASAAKVAATPAPAAKAAAPAVKEAAAPVVAPAVKEAAAPAPKADPAPAADAAQAPAAPAAAAAPVAAAEEKKVEDAAPAAVAVEAKLDEPVQAPAAGATHVVKEGEDLVSIAIQYAVSPSALMELNNLKVTDTPKAGQVLKLPAAAK